MIINGKELDIKSCANLRGADLSGAHLRSAHLRSANLSGANLCNVDLRYANLSGADLRSANLCNVDLRSANLSGANLSGANLRSANLCNVDLRSADLRGADLSGANLRSANLSGAKNIPALVVAQTKIVADGDIIGWKKLAHGTICKLQIPAAAKRSNATGRKCRAEFAIVMEGEGVSVHDGDFQYRLGEIVRSTEPFDENRWEECAPGIHFFITREEAEAY